VVIIFGRRDFSTLRGGVTTTTAPVRDLKQGRASQLADTQALRTAGSSPPPPSPLLPSSFTHVSPYTTLCHLQWMY
jgi:hypothetical protein